MGVVLEARLILTPESERLNSALSDFDYQSDASMPTLLRDVGMARFFLPEGG